MPKQNLILSAVCGIFLMLPAITASGLAMAQATQKEGTTGKIIYSQTGQDDTTALMTRQQQRTDMLEASVKDLRGIVETDLRQLKMQIQQLSNSASDDGSEMSADIRELKNQLERLTDSIAMTNRRMERTLEITSDVEFRLLRMEKRMQTLMTLGGQDVATKIIQQDTLGAGAQEEVQMSRDSATGTVTWTMDENDLSANLSEDEDNASQTAGDAALSSLAGDGEVADAQASQQPTTTDIAAAKDGGDIAGAPEGEQTPVAPVQPEVLPDVSPEEQYRYALSRALQNDFETAERAFAEFREFNAGHQREPDAAFWLGRVQFMRGQYEKAAMTFTQFNTDYPDDARLTDTTLWIAESVSHFATADQACPIYESLPRLVESPPASFVNRLAELSAAANCAAQ